MDIQTQAETFADTIMQIDDDVWSELGLHSRPTGAVRGRYLERMVERMGAAGLSKAELTDFFDDVFTTLEWDNAHSACSALEAFTGKVSIDAQMEAEREWCESMGIDFDKE